MSGTLVYDGDCGFCTTCVATLPRLRLSAWSTVAWQHADLESLGLTQEQCEQAVQWVAADGRISSGHAAAARLLLSSALPWRPVGALMLLPPFSWLAALVYRLVADNRMRLPGGTPACALPPAERPSGTAA